jgi:voltage-gated potassium channel
MKFFPAQLTELLHRAPRRRNVRYLLKFVAVLLGLIVLYSALFQVLMRLEGQEHSWIAGLYWTLVTMSTLGFGDIVFYSDLGRVFSVVVIISGVTFLLVLLPFTFIEFFYAPWMEAQQAKRAPRRLPDDTRGHVLLTNFDPVTTALMRKLTQYGYRYTLIVPNQDEALRLHDLGVSVMVGELDDPATYRAARAEEALLVAATGADVANTNIAFTVRQVTGHPQITTTAKELPSVEILTLAGSNHVLRLDEMLGQFLARRTTAAAHRAHIVGEFGSLFVAEATASGTDLVGRTLRDCALRERTGITIVGGWERGQFRTASAEMSIDAKTVLLLAGSREQIELFNTLYSVETHRSAPVVIIGAGRVGRATARALDRLGIDYRLIEKVPERVGDPAKYVVGDAADTAILRRAGLLRARTVMITTHHDDVNIYLAIYCRRLRPDIQIISRATHERNVPTLHRAGADFVMSYATMGANAIFNLLTRGELLLVAEGLAVFKVRTPAALAGRKLADTALRGETGCSVVALKDGDTMKINPDPTDILPPNGEVVLVGDANAEDRFLRKYSQSH